jgi:hypothetical protein
VLNPLLHILNRPPRVSFEPPAIEGLGYQPKLDDQIARQVFGLDFAAFLPP